MNSNGHLDRIRDALRCNEDESPLSQAVARLKQPFVLGDGEKWHYEGFVSMFSAVRQALASLDASISPDLPPFLVVPATIARLFGVPLDDFNWQGGQGDIRAIYDDLARIEDNLGQQLNKITDLLIQQKITKESYSTAEVAERLRKAEFTVREWCRLGQCQAEKKKPYRGGKKQWMISHDELLRLESDGPAPLRTFNS